MQGTITGLTVEKVRITTYLDKNLYEKVEQLSDEERRSLSQMAAVLIEEALLNRPNLSATDRKE
jgi:metal-responsive CopG/Arc/MetJ family transcriptional regulator